MSRYGLIAVAVIVSLFLFVLLIGSYIVDPESPREDYSDYTEPTIGYPSEETTPPIQYHSEERTLPRTGGALE